MRTLEEYRLVCKQRTDDHIMYVSFVRVRDSRYWTDVYAPMAEAMIDVDRAEKRVISLGGKI